jgi:hypothetical protein
MDNDPFAEIDDIAYELEVATHKASGLPVTDAYLNSEQRPGCRDIIKVAMIRKERKLQNVPPLAIMDEIQRLGLHQITMLTGAQYTLTLTLALTLTLINLNLNHHYKYRGR